MISKNIVLLLATVLINLVHNSIINHVLVIVLYEY